MNIGIYLSGGENWMGGLNYIYNLLFALNQIKGSFKVKLLVSAGMQDNLYKEVASLTDEIIILKEDGGIAGRTIRLTKMVLNRSRSPLITAQWKREAVDVIFPVMASIGNRQVKNWIGWIPDFQHKHMPDFFPSSELAVRDIMYKRLVRDAKLVVLSSNDALKDFCGIFPAESKKGRVLPFASTIPVGYLSSNWQQIRNKYNIPKKFLCISNQFFMHKNHKTVFESLALLKAKGLVIPLVCTGNTQDYRNINYFSQLKQFITGAGMEKQIQILGLIPRRDQVQIMRMAAAIIQPSLFEGWSTVVEDARSLGKVIFLSNIPVHREQNPPGAVYFNPLENGVLASRLEERWNSLAPGPDLFREKEAGILQEFHIGEYGRNILKIAQDAIA